MSSKSSDEGQVAVCRKCGFAGYPEHLIYCNLCQVSAEHRYCLDNMPKVDEEIKWSCEDCVQKALLKLNSQPIQTGEQRKDKQPQESPNVNDASKKSLPNLSMEYHNSTHGFPISKPVWRGIFKIYDQEFGIGAHISSKACSKVLDAATMMPGLICLELLPRSDVWPERFSTSAPADGDIALYFFEESVSEIFDKLVNDMTETDLALKAVLDKAELLIFPSANLPQPYQIFHGKNYLWGVYKVDPVADTSS